MKSGFAKLLLLSTLATILLNCSNLFAQGTIDELMTRRKPDCFDIMRNGYELLPQYHKRQQIDSVEAVLVFWEDHCGQPEELIRFKTLLAIEQKNGFVDSLLQDAGTLKRLMDYKSFARYTNVSDLSGHLSYPFSDENEYIQFTDYTLSWAKRLLLERNDLTRQELFFLRIYSHDFDGTFSMLREESFNGTLIQRQYNIKVEDASIYSWFRGEISLGGWFPSQNLAILGNHAGGGIGGGVQHKKWHGMVAIKGHFGDSKQPREVYHEDSLYITDKFLQVSLTLNVGYALIAKNQHNFEVVGGIGYNGLSILEVANPIDADNPETIERNGLLLNAGLGYRYDFPLGTYIGLSARFNFTHFDNRQGTDLTGNYLTIHLALGLISEDRQKHNRQMLGME